MAIPSGLVCFLFTDVEGSTALWEADEPGMAASLEAHDRVLRHAITDAGGYVFNTAGDSFACAFTDPAVAVTVARHIQTRLANLTWPGPTLKVRIGLHVGTPQVRDDDYFGVAPAIAARVEAAGHGGQTLATPAVVSAAGLTDTVELGDYPLRGVEGLTTIHQLNPGTFPKLRITPPAKVTLPATPNPLLGREDDVQRVSAAVKSNRLVNLTGPGGTGKTRLAIEVADRVTPSFPDGVTFIDLTTVPRDGQIAETVMATLGRPTDENALDSITATMAEQRRLVVLDNCEHVIESAVDLLAAITSVDGDGAVLATSRESFDLPAERIVPIQPLTTAAGTGPAEALFRERAQAIGVALPQDPATTATITELVQRLDGMPLAIELAAARTRTTSPAQLLASLDDRFALLTAGRRRRVSAGRHAALETTVAWSYDLLDDDERDLFDRCGILVGSADITTLTALAGLSGNGTTDLVDSLVAKSMVVPLEGVLGRRFRLLDTLRDYARARLEERGEFEETHDRLCVGLHLGYRSNTSDIAADERLVELAWAHAETHGLRHIAESERREVRQSLLMYRLKFLGSRRLSDIDLDAVTAAHSDLMDGRGERDLDLLCAVTGAQLEERGRGDTEKLAAHARRPDVARPQRMWAVLRAETYHWFADDSGNLAPFTYEEAAGIEDPEARRRLTMTWFTNPRTVLDERSESLAEAVVTEWEGCGWHYDAAWLREGMGVAQALAGRPLTVDPARVTVKMHTVPDEDWSGAAALLRQLLDAPPPGLHGFSGESPALFAGGLIAAVRVGRPDLARDLVVWAGPELADVAFGTTMVRQLDAIDAIRASDRTQWRRPGLLSELITRVIDVLDARAAGTTSRPLHAVPETPTG